MTGTGRLTGELGRRTQRVIYGPLPAAQIEAELPLMTRVDQAHLVMLAEQKLISAQTAAELLRCIGALAADRFRPLHGRPAPRGLYLMYEGYLIERLGPHVGGVLQTGRSRNDLKATMTSLRLRDWLLGFAEQAARLEAVLLSRARACQHLVMPVYTHFQAALPVSYGYYLLGVALAAGREIDAAAAAADGLRACPLGAGAVAGTDLPIDPGYPARLLGYPAATQHALDAVASRDVPLRLLGAAAGLAIVLSRLAADLQLWSTAEFGFIAFPDRLVGGSSAMPQKRNAFLLEHLRAKPGQALGGWAAAASMMSATPFTNSIEVGTEAMAAIWPGLQAALDSVALAQVVVSGARPAPDRMSERARDSFTMATSVANRLVSRGMAFRAAHHLVGEAVRKAVNAGSTDLAAFGPPGWLDDLGDLGPPGGACDPGGSGPPGLEPGQLMAEQAYGGGPGAFGPPYAHAVAAWAGHRDWHRRWRESLRAAEAELAEAVARWSR